MVEASCRVLVTGTFCSLNKGDAAMRIAMADELKRLLPNCHVVITTPYPEIDSSAYRCDAIMLCSRRRPTRVANMLLRSILWRCLHPVIGKHADCILDKELRAYRSSDIVIDLSGDGITEEYGPKCLVAHVVPVMLGELLKRPTFICAQTIGPLHKTRGLCAWLFKHADMVTAREKITFDYLSNMGINSKKLSLTADMAFLMAPASAERGREILEREGVPFDKPIIGFSISRLPGHILGSEEGADSTCLEREFARTLDQIAAMGIRPVFISHTTGPGERRDDRVAASRVAELTKPESGVFALKGDYSAEEIKAVIGQMDVFCGVRMHSCIGAMSMRVPTISIAYGPKAYGIMSLAGQEQWMIDIRKASSENLLPLVRRIWQQKTEVKRSLEENMVRVQSLARQNLDIVKQLLDKSN